MRYKLNKLNMILNALFKFETNNKKTKEKIKLIYLILIMYVN